MSVMGQSRHFAPQKNSGPFRRRAAMQSVTDLPIAPRYPSPHCTGIRSGHVLLTRVPKWSALKAWGIKLATCRVVSPFNPEQVRLPEDWYESSWRKYSALVREARSGPLKLMLDKKLYIAPSVIRLFTWLQRPDRGDRACMDK